MKNIKKFISCILTMLIVLTLAPIKILEKKAEASQNQSSIIFGEGSYLRGIEQWGNKAIISYSQGSRSENDYIKISIIENGKETIIKKLNGYDDIELIKSKNDSNLVLIRNVKTSSKESEEDFYEKYDFTTNKIESINKEEWKENKNATIDQVKNVEKLEVTHEIANELISRIAEEKKLNISIKEEDKVEDNYKNNKGSLSIKMSKYYDDIIMFTIFNTRYFEENVREISGVLVGDYLYVKDENEVLGIKLRGNDKYYITVETENELYEFQKAEFISIENKQFISKIEIENLSESEYFVCEIAGDLYFVSQDENGNGILNRYELKEDKYIYKNTYNIVLKIYDPINNEINFIENKDGKFYLSKIDSLGEKNIIWDITDDFKSTFEGNRYLELIPKENATYIINTQLGARMFMIVQPESQDELVEIPNKVEIQEIEILDPKRDNEIKVNSKNSIEILIKDIEALKSTEGSINVIANNLEIKLPLAAIKNIDLEGAKSVSLVGKIVENKEIEDKISKGYKKVFEFNLLVNKEDGQVDIHNFNSEVEITLKLEDKDFEGLNKDKIKAYYYNETTKTFEEKETLISGNNVIFKTNHFSKYVIAEELVENKVVEDNKEEVNKPQVEVEKELIEAEKEVSIEKNNNVEGKGKETLPETGGIISNNTLLLLALGMVSIGGVFLFRKKIRE